MALTEPSQQTDRPPRTPDVDAKRDFRPERCDVALELVSTDDRTSALWDAAERFVYSEYRVTNFCEPSRREWVEEAEPYRPGSTLHVMLDRGLVVGAIRTMFGRYEQLPIGNFGHDIAVPDVRLAEVGSLAVSRDLRGLGVANELHRRAVQQAIEAGVPAFCMLVEPWSIEFFRDVYGLPLVQSAPAREYMGSLTVPAIADIPHMLLTFARERPGMFKWLTEDLDPSVWSNGTVPVLLD